MSLHFRDSDSELAYATPVGSFWLPTAPGLDGRQRRSRGSSDDNEDQDYPENFVNTDYRAGGPYLAPSPVKTYNLPSYYSSFEALRENPHYAAVRGILRKWEVEIRDYGVSMRRAQFYPNDKPIPTLYIVSRKRRQDESWVSAALEIRAYLVNRGFKDVSVEIADQLAFRQALCFPVHNTDSIYPLWDKVCDSILGTFDLTDWRILECFRHGFSSNRFDNPPTVMVTVDRRSTKKWKKVRESIIEILKGFGLGGVAVRISKGSVMLAAGPPHEEIPSAAWEGRAMLGVSMGPSENPYGSATFGGFIELMNREKKWFKFGLTCYHAILPSLIYEQQESELRKLVGGWNKNGIDVSDKTARARLCPMQPSQRDTNKRLENLDNEISSMEKSEVYQDRSRKLREGELFGPELRVHLAQEKSLSALKAQKEKIESFRDNKGPFLGQVFAASGFSTQKKQGGSDLTHRDWALIKMAPGRIGNNAINACGTPKFGLPDTILSSPRQPVEDLEVFKLGRTTEWTNGRFAGLRSAHIATSDEHGETHTVVTREYCVTGTGGPFSLEGDSGSLVFDRDMRVVGMIFSGSLAENVSYITLFDDLFGDIKKRTGAQDVRIPE